MPTVQSHSQQSGYSLVELSIAMAIALFLLAGLLTILQGTRRTSTDQNQLAQLQDEQRVAMTMITDVVQQAGYFPNAQAVDPSVALPASATFTTAGQSVYGAAGAYGDTITVRYQGDSTGAVLDCRGSVIPAGTLEEMTFSVKLQPTTNQPELYCSVNGVDAPLVANVQSLAISYGVDTSGGNAVDTYLPASQMAPYWTSVYSVKITVTFGNPLFGQPGQTSATIPFSRVIGVMSRSGVNVLNFT